MSVTPEHARAAGDALSLNWGVVPLPTWQAALAVELEHGSALGPATNVTGDDLVATGRIALAHLVEDPYYYQRLAHSEAEGDAYWAPRAKPSPTRDPPPKKSASALVTVLVAVLIVLLVVVLAATLATLAAGPGAHCPFAITIAR